MPGVEIAPSYKHPAGGVVGDVDVVAADAQFCAFAVVGHIAHVSFVDIVATDEKEPGVAGGVGVFVAASESGVGSFAGPRVRETQRGT